MPAYRALHILIVAVALLTACASEPQPEAPRELTKSAEVSAPPQATNTDLIGAARSALSTPLERDLDISTLVDQAEALDKWAENQPPERQLEAALLSGNMQLVALVLSTQKSTLPLSDESLLRRIATMPALAESELEEALEVKEAALAILGLDTAVKDVRINSRAALNLAASESLAGQAVRAVWLERTRRGLVAWSTLPSELKAGAALPLSGRMLCPRCADAHHITPDQVVPLLLGQGNKGGAICDRAIAAGREAKVPSSQTGAISLCEELWPSDELADPALFWGTNVPVIALLRNARTLSRAPVTEGPLSALISERRDQVQAMLERPWVLPTAIVSAAKRAPGMSSPHLFIPNLGGAGLSTQHAPLALFSLGPDGLRVGLRPTLAFEEERLVSLSVRAGLPAGGKAVLTLEELSDAPRDAQGAIAAITSATNEVQQASQSIFSALGHKEAQAKGVTFALDAESSSEHTARTLKALKAAGVSTVHVLKSASHGHTLPLMISEEASGTRELLNNASKTSYDTPMITLVHRGHIDVWAPDGAKGEENPPKQRVKAPVGTTLSFRGKKLVRIRVAIADPESGLSQSDLELFDKAVTYFLRRDNAAPLLHVVADKGSRAADVLLIARRFQEREGKAIEAPHALWPGSACGGTSYKENRRTPDDCASGVAVFFSSIKAPSQRGLSSRPAGAALSKTKSEEAPAPQADESFCNKKDIRVAMNRSKGSFRFCYQRELQAYPDLAGRVVLRFTIGTDGRPKGASIASSSLSNKNAHACILKTIKRMTFKPPKGGVCPVRWPFTFQPR